MVRLKGTSDSESIFGTDGRDFIRGLGGRDVLQANGGADTITGFGQIYGNEGRDRYYAFATSSADVNSANGSFLFLGDGNDTAVIHRHDGDATFNGGDLAFGMAVDMGAGSDRLILAGDVGTGTAHARLGAGRDTAFLMSTYANVWVNDTRSGTLGVGDGKRDTIHIDGHVDLISPHTTTVKLFDFGLEDKIVLHGIDLTYDDMLLRSTFVDTSERTVEISLENGSVIRVSKLFSGHLNEDQLKIKAQPLQIEDRVVIGHEGHRSQVLLGSSADETFRQPGSAVYMGAGDDRGIGGRSAEAMFGERGDDRLAGKGGRDFLDGGLGNDRLEGGRGRDTITTGAGIDTVRGGDGNDKINVGNGSGVIFGGRGDDVFDFYGHSLGEIGDTTGQNGGGLTVTGGAGRDVFHFGEPDEFGADPSGLVTISDFHVGRDLIDLSDYLRDQYANSGDAEARIMANLANGSQTLGGTQVEGVRVRTEDVTIFLIGITAEELSSSDFLF
ncbi:calcium-binding protein [Leisingera methylohalidivorans]|nr:calcium-binding protein [Leisingera methylohalidivorans]